MTLELRLGDRIRFARVLKGFSQQQLGAFISTSRQYVHQIESGTSAPSSDVLAAICEALDITPTFLQGVSQNELKPEQCHFRKRRATSLSLAARVAAFGTLLEDVIRYLDQFVDLPPPFSFEITKDEVNADGSYSRDAIEQISERFRENQRLGIDTPISNVIALLERLGVIVTSFAGVSAKVDAFSFSRGRHFILRNLEKSSACRQRFDLAHELGHLILHQGVETGCHATEAEADHFGSAFLFPRKAFIREFPLCLSSTGQFRWMELQKLKLRWKVSLKAIIYRAHSLGLIDSRQYRGANVKLSKDGLPEHGDGAIVLEEPTLLSNSLELLNEELQISFSEFSKRLGLSPMYLSGMIGINFDAATEHNNINVSALKPIRLA